MSLWKELKRRHVVKVAIGYAVVAWLLIQIAVSVFPVLSLPHWTVVLVTVLLIMGFPVALVLAWAYDLTPSRVERAPDGTLEKTANGASRALDFLIIGVLVIAVAYLAIDRFVFVSERPPSAVAADRRSIAVLPFANESAAEENAEFLANGIHDELLTRLAKVGSLKVISRTSVMEYRDSPKNTRDIGRELGVATLLEGRVQRVGDKLRINVQLIDAEADEHVWAEIYDRQLTAENVFAVQSEMATSIAAALEAKLSPEEAVSVADIPTQDTRAYDFFLTGSEYLRRGDYRTYLPLAIQMLERAVAQDPEFGLAHAKLSIAHGQMYSFGYDRTEKRLEMSAEAARRALMFAPESPEAHLAMGYYYYRGLRDYERALDEFSIAEHGLPGSAEVAEARAYVLRRLGRWEESLQSLARSIELDPRNATLLFNQAATYNMLRDYARAESHLDRALEIEPDNVNAYVFRAELPLRRDGDVARAKRAAESPPFDIGVDRQQLGWTAAIFERDYDRAVAFLDDWDLKVLAEEYEYLPKSAFYGITFDLAGQPERANREFQAARAELEAALQGRPEDARLYISLAEVLAGLDQNEEAARLARRAVDLTPPSRDAYAAPDYQLLASKVFAAAGDRDAAIAALDAYLGAPGDWSIEGLAADPRFDSIREDPRFDMLIEKYGRR
jgi:TolB-like protein/Tfp pilus assembly protein PilF